MEAFSSQSKVVQAAMILTEMQSNLNQTRMKTIEENEKIRKENQLLKMNEKINQMHNYIFKQKDFIEFPSDIPQKSNPIYFILCFRFLLINKIFKKS